MTRASRTLLFFPLVTAGYVVTGRLGLLLAVPPGYATAIFLPAGIAVAAVLTRGPATLPWVFVGSLILNSWIGYEAGAGALSTALAAAVLIAAASTAQAALAGWALRRTIGDPPALDDGAAVLRFLALPPLCCLTSATLSVGGLWGLGIVTRPELVTSWLVWWVGDTLGVLFALPLILVLVGEPRALWRARFRPVALPMLLFFALFVVIFIRVSGWENDERMLQFRLLSQQAVDKIRTRLEEQEVFIDQIERSFSRATPVGREEFRDLVKSILQRFPMVQAVEWAPRVGAAERAMFEAAQRSALPGFEIREIAAPDRLKSAVSRGQYYPVTYVEPLTGNEVAVGLDLAADPDRRAAVAAALASDEVVATRPIRLVQEPGGQTGLLLLRAVQGGATGEGLVVVALRMGAFIDPLLADIEEALGLRMVDATRQQNLYDSLAAAGGGVARYRQEFAFAQRRYLVETVPSALYLAQHRGWQSWVLLVAGMFGTGLLGALLLLGTGYTHRIAVQVEERTRDLATANRQLRIESAERQQVESALRQAQRMEAIGRLTGGIAHDFNNLLTVVSANAELLGGEAPGESAQRRTAAILRAAGRGERLTRQLLAFSRQQTLHPESVELRQRTAEIGEMLLRTMRADIEMTLDLPEGLWPVAIDPDEFDLAILNIAANARDAMPGGGQFRVAARNLTLSPGDPHGEGLCGDFVALTLADTGAGMRAEVLAHAFDPYFTTKEVGAGSGLGLSQVYGFAKQSGGAAVLASEPGAGTTVTLLFPRAPATAEAAGAPADVGTARGMSAASSGG